MKQALITCLTILALQANIALAAELKISANEANEVGRKVWKNECGGSIEGLTSWNKGEEFPSLGIGHFIWYPEGVKGPFLEKFPDLLRFLKKHDVKLPDWLRPGMACPWKTRDEFNSERQSKKMIELRNLLASTVGLQTDYLIQRLENALPQMLEKASTETKTRVQNNFDRMLAAGSRGAFALIDYVNFKGEGVLETERYNGKGWGMLQVLEGMSEKSEDPVKAFADSAVEALTRRVENSPKARHEEVWLNGWSKRVNAYYK